MDKQPLISIIIPVYNVEKYLHSCLDSVLAQTYKNLEIILVDDGSTDTSGSICDEYAQKDTRIKVFHKRNEGVALARNLGLDKAQGEYIGFVDSDDVIHPDMYRILFEQLQITNSQISVCQIENMFVGKKATFPTAAFEQQIIPSSEDMCLCLGGGYHFSHVIWNKLYRASALQHIRFNTQLRFEEDVEFLIRLSDYVTRIVIMSQVLYAYRIYPQSTIHAPRLARWIDDCKIMNYFVDFCKERHYHLALNTAQKLLFHGNVNIVFILLFSDIHNKKRNLLNKSISTMQHFKVFLSVLSSRRQRIMACFLIHFPQATIWFARLPFVRYVFNKKWHFDAYEL